LRLVPEERDH